MRAWRLTAWGRADVASARRRMTMGIAVWLSSQRELVAALEDFRNASAHKSAHSGKLNRTPLVSP